jgi:hypothetical protein
VVKIHEVKKMVEGMKKGLMIEVHHVDALRNYAEATRNDLGRLAERISQQTNFLWSKREQISSKAVVCDALKPITAISKIATTITAHKLDRAVMDLINVPKVFSEYAERLDVMKILVRLHQTNAIVRSRGVHAARTINACAAAGLRDRHEC